MPAPGRDGCLMQRISRLALWCAAVVLPAIVLAASTARGEFQAAVRQTPNPGHGEERFRTCAAWHGTDDAGVPDYLLRLLPSTGAE